MRRLLPLLALLVLAFPAHAAAQAPEPQASLPDIEDEVMCPICGVPLEHATEAPQAERERAYIRALIAEGLTKEEIKDRLVAEYGDEVLALPEAEGFDLAAWVVPVLGVLIAAGAVGFGLVRWRRNAAIAEGATDAGDRAAVPTDEAKRLDEDIARYKL
jgi:cytochrome c-type biogenesis protein CcmH